MEESNYIQTISIAKLAEYDQSRIDLPIRKYVLIANLLRGDNNKEQDWFDACLDDLQEDDEVMSEIDSEDDIMSDEEELNFEEELNLEEELNFEEELAFEKELTFEEQEKQEEIYNEEKKTHLFYNLPNGAGFIVCTSPASFS